MPRAHRRRMLKLVAIDRLHLYGVQGLSFWEKIRVLKHVFFSKIYGVRGYHPPFLMMTAAMTSSLLLALKDLTCVDWTRSCHQMWSSACDFRQCYVQMHFKATFDIGQKALPPTVNHLKEATDVCVCLYVNFIWECSKWDGALEKLFPRARRGSMS